MINCTDADPYTLIAMCLKVMFLCLWVRNVLGLAFHCVCQYSNCMPTYEIFIEAL